MSSVLVSYSTKSVCLVPVNSATYPIDVIVGSSLKDFPVLVDSVINLTAVIVSSS